MVRRALKVFVVSTFFVSALVAQLVSPSQRGFSDSSDVTIQVNDVTNAPANDVRVEILTAGTRNSVMSGYTTVSGVVTLANVPNGSYEVVATKGIATSSERLEVANMPVSVQLRLPGEDATATGTRGMVSVAQYKVPGKARKSLQKAQDAFSKQDIERATKEIDKALELHPQFAEALTLRGIIKLDAEDNDGAIEDMSNAIKADPGYATAYIALGAAFNRAQRFDEALQTLDRGLAIDPMSWQGYFELGKARVSKGDYQGGLRSLDRAQSISADKYAPLHLVKAHALLAMKQYETAMLELQSFLSKAPQAPQSAAAREMMERTKAFLAGK
jgi:tetratricopeptide (TPR) repeat protein